MAGYPGGGPAFYARKATGDDITLGRRLSRELAEIRQFLVNGDTDAILTEIPSAYKNWMASNGYDPVDTWTQQRLADLILNRGQHSAADFAGEAEGDG
jgi:hypothetical protein